MTPQAPESPFFRALAGVVLRFRWLLLLVTFATTGLAASEMRQLQVDTSVERFLDKNDASIVYLKEVRDAFGQDNLFLVLVEGDVFSTHYLERLERLHQALEKVDIEQQDPDGGASAGASPDGDGVRAPSSSPAASSGQDGFTDGFADDEGWGDERAGTIVEQVVSLLNVRQTRWRGGALQVEGLMERRPSEAELPALKKRVLADRTLVGQVVDREGRYSVIVVRTGLLSARDQDRAADEVIRVAQAHQADGFRVMVTGPPVLLRTLNQLTFRDQATMTALAVSVVLVFAFFIFRHPLGVFGPALVVIQAVIWTLGLMAALGIPLSVTTSLLSAFIICVGCGDSVHVLSVYRDSRAAGMQNPKAIVHAVATTGIPVLYTSLTTAVGLLSFRLASLGGISEMGTFSAFGVIAAFFNSVCFLPIVLSFNRKSLLGSRPPAEKRRPLDRFLDLCNDLSRPNTTGSGRVFARRNAVLLIAAAAVLAAAAGVARLRVHHNAINWFPSEHPARVALDNYERTVGGAANILVMVNAPEGKTIKDRQLLRELEKLEGRILAYRDGRQGSPVVHNVISVLDPVRESWRALNGGQQRFYRLPEAQRAVSDMFTLFEMAGAHELRRLATIDLARALMVVRVRWMDALSYLPLKRHIEQAIAATVGPLAEVHTTGSIYVDILIISRLLFDLFKSFGAALLVITLIMLVLLRELKLGLLAMLPNLLPILCTMGFMGFVSIPIDLSTILLGSLAIGIVVDDTIHFLHQFKAHFRLNRDVERALQHAYDHTGRAMVITSSILMIGFFCNVAASLVNFRLSGILLGLTIAFAVFFDLVFTPALLRAAYRSDPPVPRAPIGLKSS